MLSCELLVAAPIFRVYKAPSSRRSSVALDGRGDGWNSINRDSLRSNRSTRSTRSQRTTTTPPSRHQNGSTRQKRSSQRSSTRSRTKSSSNQNGERRGEIAPWMSIAPSTANDSDGPGSPRTPGRGGRRGHENDGYGSSSENPYMDYHNQRARYSRPPSGRARGLSDDLPPPLDEGPAGYTSAAQESDAGNFPPPPPGLLGPPPPLADGPEPYSEQQSLAASRDSVAASRPSQLRLQTPPAGRPEPTTPRKGALSSPSSPSSQSSINTEKSPAPSSPLSSPGSTPQKVLPPPPQLMTYQYGASPQHRLHADSRSQASPASSHDYQNHQAPNHTPSQHSQQSQSALGHRPVLPTMTHNNLQVSRPAQVSRPVQAPVRLPVSTYRDDANDLYTKVVPPSERPTPHIVMSQQSGPISHTQVARPPPGTHHTAPVGRSPDSDFDEVPSARMSSHTQRSPVGPVLKPPTAQARLPNAHPKDNTFKRLVSGGLSQPVDNRHSSDSKPNRDYKQYSERGPQNNINPSRDHTPAVNRGPGVMDGTAPTRDYANVHIKAYPQSSLTHDYSAHSQPASLPQVGRSLSGGAPTSHTQTSRAPPSSALTGRAPVNGVSNSRPPLNCAPTHSVLLTNNPIQNNESIQKNMDLPRRSAPTQNSSLPPWERSCKPPETKEPPRTLAEVTSSYGGLYASSANAAKSPGARRRLNMNDRNRQRDFTTNQNGRGYNPTFINATDDTKTSSGPFVSSSALMI